MGRFRAFFVRFRPTESDVNAGDRIATIVGGDVPVKKRRSRAASLLAITEAQLDTALAYYADFTDEIDSALAERAKAADESEQSWHRRRAMLQK